MRRLLKKLLPHTLYNRYVGRHEHGSLRIWQTLATRLSDRDAILDIGAFHGEYSMSARSVNQYVAIFAFEPNPASLDVLREKCSKSSICFEPYAVAGESGMVSFSLLSAMSHIQHGVGREIAEVVQVQAVSLDDWAKKHASLVISLMKIDVEGAESDVLAGAESILTTQAPLILCEILSNQAGRRVMDMLPKNYVSYRIDENRGLQPRSIVTREHWRNKNWLFVPEGKINFLEGVL